MTMLIYCDQTVNAMFLSVSCFKALHQFMIFVALKFINAISFCIGKSLWQRELCASVLTAAGFTAWRPSKHMQSLFIQFVGKWGG